MGQTLLSGAFHTLMYVFMQAKTKKWGAKCTDACACTFCGVLSFKFTPVWRKNATIACVNPSKDNTSRLVVAALFMLCSDCFDSNELFVLKLVIHIVAM